MLNHIVIMGRLTRDPELRRTGSGVAVTSFSVAVDRDFSNKESGERETDFIDCVAWRSTGEFVAKYFQKGSMAVVSGRLQMPAGPIRKATSAAARRSWQTMSTSALPSGTMLPTEATTATAMAATITAALLPIITAAVIPLLPPATPLPPAPPHPISRCWRMTTPSCPSKRNFSIKT